MEVMAAATLQFEKMLSEQTQSLDSAIALSRAQLPDDVYHRMQQSLSGMDKLTTSVHELGNGFREIEDVVASSSKSVVSSVARALDVSRSICASRRGRAARVATGSMTVRRCPASRPAFTDPCSTTTATDSAPAGVRGVSAGARGGEPRV